MSASFASRKFDAEVWFAGENSGKASSQVATSETDPSPCLLSLKAHSLNSQTFLLQPASIISPESNRQHSGRYTVFIFNT